MLLKMLEIAFPMTKLSKFPEGAYPRHLPDTPAFARDCFKALKVPLRRKFVGLFPPNSVAEYRVVSIFTQKTEQKTSILIFFSAKVA